MFTLNVGVVVLFVYYIIQSAFPYNKFLFSIIPVKLFFPTDSELSSSISQAGITI